MVVEKLNDDYYLLMGLVRDKGAERCGDRVYGLGKRMSAMARSRSW